MASILVRGVRKLGRITRRRLKPLLGPASVAVVGCGGIGPTHIVGFDSLFKTRVAAVSDLSPIALADALDQWPFVRAFRDYQQMLHEVQPDIVSVCTWPQHHAEIVCAAARAGAKGILCEKPLALSLVDIEEMVSVCHEQRVKLGCGHHYRFHPVFLAAAAAIAKGKLGSVSRVRGFIRGSLANNGPHLIDTIRFVLGDPAARRVECHLVRDEEVLERGLPREQTARSVVHFEGDVECEIETGHPDPMMFRIEIDGTAGTLAVTPTTLDVCNRTKSFSGDRVLRKCRHDQFAEFESWTRGNRAMYSADASSGAATAELVLACYEAARLGELVSLPLNNKSDVICRLFDVPENDTRSATSSTFTESKIEPSQLRAEELAIDGGQPALRRWFSAQPHFGLPELVNVAKVLRTRNLNCVGGTAVPALENEFASYYASHSAVASTSGTSAIHVALGALDLEPCDEVITTPLSDMGTVIPILACNCIPVFADVDPETGNLTAETIKRQITPRTRAVILVHLFGRPAELPQIAQLLRQQGIALIEDCAQAHGASFDGAKVGTFGDFGCFSLQQSKQISCGDGGMTLVNNADLAERARLFTDKGWARRGGRCHRFLGLNYRMTELQGAVALAQFRKLPRLLRARREAAEALMRGLRTIEGIALPTHDERVLSSWWKFPLGIDERIGCTLDQFGDVLRVEGVRFMRTYLPRPLFEEEMFRFQRTYGQSGFPFSAVDYDPPHIRQFLGLSRFNQRWLLVDWGSRVRPSHVKGIEHAVRKASWQFARQATTASIRQDNDTEVSGSSKLIVEKRS